MIFTEVVSLSASIATCITAIIILFTLIEMKKQRNMTYKPSVVPVRQHIFGNHYRNSFFWTTEQIEIDDTKDYFDSYSIRLFNLGNGAAKSIFLKWKFDITTVIDSLNKLFQKNMSQIYLEVDASNWLALKGEEVNDQIFNVNCDLEGKYEHLLPASVDKTGIFVRIPNTFTILVSHYFDEISKLPWENHKEFRSKVPKIDLSIEYEDIGGKIYNDIFTFEINLCTYSDKSFHATLENKLST